MNRAALKLGLGSFPAITVALHLKNLRSCSVCAAISQHHCWEACQDFAQPLHSGSLTHLT